MFVESQMVNEKDFEKRASVNRGGYKTIEVTLRFQLNSFVLPAILI
jgi:hypothetical protein